MFTVGEEVIYIKQESEDPVPQEFLGCRGVVVHAPSSAGAVAEPRYRVLFHKNKRRDWYVLASEMRLLNYPESEEG